MRSSWPLVFSAGLIFGSAWGQEPSAKCATGWVRNKAGNCVKTVLTTTTLPPVTTAAPSDDPCCNERPTKTVTVPPELKSYEQCEKVLESNDHCETQQVVKEDCRCCENFQLVFLIDIRDAYGSSKCTPGSCSVSGNTFTYIQNWIYRIIYEVKEKKGDDPNQNDFAVVVQFPTKTTPKVVVTFADDVIKADSTFGNKIMAMAKEVAAEDMRPDSQGTDLIDALESVTDLIRSDFSNWTDVRASAELQAKWKGADKDVKRFLFTVTQGFITIEDDQRERTQRVINEATDGVFFRMDVVTIQHARSQYTNGVVLPLLQSPNGIYYEYGTYTELLDQTNVENVVTHLCDNVAGASTAIAADDTKHLVDLVFAIDASWCVCEDDDTRPCCTTSRMIYENMRKMIKETADKVTKEGGYVLGKDTTTRKKSLRIGAYVYYKKKANRGTSKEDEVYFETVLDLVDWDNESATTSLDKFRYMVQTNYKQIKEARASTENTIYIQEVLTQLESSSGSSSGSSPASAADSPKTYVETMFAQEIPDTNTDNDCYTRILVIFPSENAAHPGEEGFTKEMDLQAQVIRARMDIHLDIIAMPIKDRGEDKQSAESSIVNTMLRVDAHSTYISPWSALRRYGSKQVYEDARSTALAELILRLATSRCPIIVKELPKCYPKVKYVCNVTVSYKVNDCLLGPVGPKGAKGRAGPPGGLGPVGPATPPGPSGPDGIPGRQGPRGTDGTKGADGAKGEKGAVGRAGSTGAAGNHCIQKSKNVYEIFSWTEIQEQIEKLCPCQKCQDKDALETDQETQPGWWYGEHSSQDSFKKYFTDYFFHPKYIDDSSSWCLETDPMDPTNCKRTVKQDNFNLKQDFTRIANTLFSSDTTAEMMRTTKTEYSGR